MKVIDKALAGRPNIKLFVGDRTTKSRRRRETARESKL
jgi:hypothetical protein